jgi:hypothetical protein
LGVGLPLLLFLGAGASRPFNIPTMSEMVLKFSEQISKRPDDINQNLYETMRDTYETIRNQQLKFYGYSDLESVFSVVMTIAENKSYKDLGHSQAYFFSKHMADITTSLVNQQDQQAAAGLVGLLQKYVRDVCKLTPSMEDEVDRVYGNMFEQFAGLLSEHTLDKGGKRYPYGDYRMYTTNYDLSMETYWKGVLDLNDTFSPSAGIQVMNTERATENNMKLIKLHGSIDWYRLADKTIVKSETLRSRIGKSNVDAELMLYPTEQKDLYLDPWIQLFSAFKRDLAQSNLWIVIGYRFNDRFVRNMFVEAFEKRPRLLILIDPNAEQILQAAFGRRTAYKKFVSKKFGDPQTISDVVRMIRESQSL